VLYAIGLGLDIRAHISNEAKQALKSCRVVYVLSPDSIALDLIKGISPVIRVVDCSPYYDEEDVRPKVYDNIANDIINEADNFTNVGIAVYGNPMFLVSAVEKIIDKAELNGIKTKVIPAISSFDTLLADLKLDLGYGVTILDASLLLSSNLNVETKLPLLLFQVANIGSIDVERGEIKRDRLKPLVDYLVSIYPPDHKCKLVVSSKGVFDPGYIVDTTVSDLLTNKNINLSHRPSLYIPEIDS
jgi:uncharacterized protein YabN with tetrapyrrole methylase and pyrophosphatase domain